MKSMEKEEAKLHSRIRHLYMQPYRIHIQTRIFMFSQAIKTQPVPRNHTTIRMRFNFGEEMLILKKLCNHQTTNEIDELFQKLNMTLNYI